MSSGSESENNNTGSATHPPVLGGVVAHLTLSDAVAATAFYRRAFDAEEVMTMQADDGKRIMYSHLRINGGSVFLNDAFPEWGHASQTPQSFVLHLQVDDVESWWSRAIAAGAEVVMKLDNQFWGDRYGQVRDPFGVTWSMGSPIAK